MLDGAARIDDLVAAAVDDGQPALGDHRPRQPLRRLGLLRRVPRARASRPIIGTEAYMAAESRHERPVRRGRVDDTGGDAEGGKLYYHLTLLAETNAGYANLLKLSSAAFLEGYYYKPRVDWELLERYHEGLIATSGCLGGVVLQSLLAGDDARRARRRPRGSRTSSVATASSSSCRTTASTEQRATNPKLLEIARSLGAPLLATNDSHYTRRDDAIAHDALLCVQTGALLDDEKRFRFEGTEHYLKSAAEMRHLFGDVEERVRQHAAHRRARERRDRVRPPVAARVRGARAHHGCDLRGARRGVPARAHLRGRDATLRRRGARRVRAAPRLRARRDRERWASPRTSSSCGTSSGTRARAASASGPGRGSSAGELRRVLPATSSTSTRSATTCCSSGS